MWYYCILHKNVAVNITLVMGKKFILAGIKLSLGDNMKSIRKKKSDSFWVLREEFEVLEKVLPLSGHKHNWNFHWVLYTFKVKMRNNSFANSRGHYLEHGYIF